jgi:hypothetical protein
LPRWQPAQDPRVLKDRLDLQDRQDRKVPKVPEVKKVLPDPLDQRERQAPVVV